uniref:Small ribosomal subunit protein uS7c n=1 Tax=Lepocinclis tripteris TaxID=135494 RepID=A0A3G3LKZ2_9EUGL|nr:ribosomal protein S7 [Lepocinclis tripteris]AYQ93383.1 ribosomal protein S7 [Lepocinclis tripteris]
MSRRKTAKKRLINQDPIYNSKLVSLFINKIMLKGKKSIAQTIFYNAIKKAKESLNKDAMEILEKSVNNSTPVIELKTKRIGGTTYQVPVEIRNDRKTSLALSFIIKSARKRPGKDMISKLGNEIIDSFNNTGNSVKKKEELHRSAETNKAFASFK